MRELAAYSPARSRRAITVELDDRSETAVLGLLAAVETCLTANEIRSVRIELETTSTMSRLLAPRSFIDFAGSTPSGERPSTASQRCFFTTTMI